MKQYFYLIILLTLLLCSCKEKRNENIVQHRPANVPNSAVWVGGMKGGTFIDCKLTNSKKREYICNVYAETGVELLKGGKYELKYAVWNKEKNGLDYYDLDDEIATSVYYDIYISETSDIELGGRLVLKPSLSQATK
ncbi:hypothetical protein E6P70_10100 [Moraxella nonliquefaciens]|jgi:lipoprotein|uniref:hypothetical protein n=1 Tax=Moraxella nonliquefaciens TaxID=478 RepID=UPI0024A69B6B|nr:hypothetical protein [Moraxella nonliquefaciens]MDI4498708.1 hypothetical protein [Moraxella nonliquefaciens]MDI4500934.1 hypothetical protein [Moraxella nonliquefaciens]